MELAEGAGGPAAAQALGSSAIARMAVLTSSAALFCEPRLTSLIC